MSTAAGSTLGLDVRPVVGVHVGARYVGWVVRAGPELLAAGRWESPEARAQWGEWDGSRRAAAAESGRAVRRGGNPGLTVPPPVTSLPSLLTELDAALAEHTPAALAWWRDHDGTTPGSPWLVAVNAIPVPDGTARGVAAQRAWQPVPAVMLVAGAVLGWAPGPVVVVPAGDAADRHRAPGASGDLRHYWPRRLLGTRARTAHGDSARAAWTVAGDAAAACTELGDGRSVRVIAARSGEAEFGRSTAGEPASTPTPVGPSGPAYTGDPSADRGAYAAALRDHATHALGPNGPATWGELLAAAATAVNAVPAPAGTPTPTPLALATHLARSGHDGNLADGLTEQEIRGALEALAALTQ